VPYVDHKYGKSGSLWEGRYKASLVQEESYFLKVMKYTELNPVRASMVELPGHYRWSSFCHNSGEKHIQLINYHNCYLSLGTNDQARQESYLGLFNIDLSRDDMKRIRETWQSETPLGNDYFLQKVEPQFASKVGQTQRGRPSSSEKVGPL